MPFWAENNSIDKVALLNSARGKADYVCAIWSAAGVLRQRSSLVARGPIGISQ
jgi:hypothetical protein